VAGLVLSPEQNDMLQGADGPAVARAMRVICTLADVSGAASLVSIGSAHIDSCLYHGPAGLDFAELMVRDGGQVRVPTTLNVASLDLLHPDLVLADDETRVNGRRLMDTYLTMGCRPTFTCAPYQADSRPGFGEHVAWAESNAIVFANSVLGARTDRYGDFLDICAALAGCAPLAGLHLDENRLAGVVFDVTSLPDSLLTNELLPAVLGYLVGGRSGTAVPAIVGLPQLSEDALKAFGAAAASSGGIGLFHIVGSTPEAPTLHDVLPRGPGTHAMSGRVPTVRLAREDVLAARAELTTTVAGPVEAVSVGTPHCSLAEIERVATLIAGRFVDPEVACYLSTGRSVLAQAFERGFAQTCEQAGVQFVTDTCTYITPILRSNVRVVMTNSGKWAHYAPGNLGVEVVLGSLSECVDTACSGQEVRRDRVWTL
jgi:predicted aconitase